MTLVFLKHLLNTYTIIIRYMYNSSDLEKQIHELKMKIRKDCLRYDEVYKVGTEVEGCLLDDKSIPVNASDLIEELSDSSFFKRTGCMIDYEYGSCQFEFKTPPISFKNLSTINELYEEFIIENLSIAIEKVYKNRHVIPVFLGSNPSPYVLNDSIVTNSDRYMRLFKWQNTFSDIEFEGRRIKPSHVAAAIQGFHFHLQSRNPMHTIQMFNHALNLIPSAILLGANSKLFAGKIYSYHEPRIYLYDRSEQQDSGFPAIPKYLDNMEDYIEYVRSRNPDTTKDYFLLEKERHDDVRIRLNSEFYRIETRIISVQPSPKSLMAMIEFFIGYLNHMTSRNANIKDTLRPLSTIREERYSSIQNGFKAKSHFNIEDSLSIHLDNAKKGLRELNINPEFIYILEKRLHNKMAPSIYVSNLWEKYYNGNIDKTISEIILEVWQRTKDNQPIF